MEKKTTLEVFTAHILIKTQILCPNCRGTCYRVFKDGTITCARCKRSLPEAEKTQLKV